jgi:hypothetical protein
MNEDLTLVHVAKFRCEGCGREIIGHLFALSEHRITDADRKDHTARTKQVHEEDCKGSLGAKPKQHSRPASKRERK